jgi:dynein heavy chain
MTGATAVDFDRPNPAGEGGWFTDKAWASIIELGKVLPAFKGFDKDFEQHLHEWEHIYNSAKPHSLKEPWPGQWNELTLFRRIIVLRILRPDKVIPAI